MPVQPEVRFVSSNRHKVDEAVAILATVGVRVLAAPIKIEEIQTSDTNKLVRDKLLKAFAQVGRPLFVEHTGLYLDHLNGLPGGLTQVFWDTLEADRFAELFGRLAPNQKATATTTIVYCDGRQLHEFSGSVGGHIASTPKGPREFQWDCVFTPDGSTETFAEMGDRKNTISMRRIALDKLAAHLKAR
jgi:XTP/dITP diphosphohydrolase